MTQARDVHIVFTHDEPTYRIVVRARLRPRTRRQQRLAARRAGTAHSFKKEWKAYVAQPGIINPFGYEFSYRFASGRSIRNAITGNVRRGEFALYRKYSPSPTG